jgi:acid phosphatase family membrane protein YuiD
MVLPDSPLVVAGVTAIVIQITKFVAYGVANRRIDFERLVSTGGMPSSHTGSVTALSASAAFREGIASTEFQIAAFFSIIVIYDAAGLRRAAGRQAMVLNRLVDQMVNEHRILVRGERPLRELLGHTPFEVVVGAIFGLIFAWFWHVFT